MRFFIAIAIVLGGTWAYGQTQLTRIFGSEYTRHSSVFHSLQSGTESVYVVDSARHLQLWKANRWKKPTKLASLYQLTRQDLNSNIQTEIVATAQGYLISFSGLSKSRDSSTLKVSRTGKVDTIIGPDLNQGYARVGDKVYYLQKLSWTSHGFFSFDPKTHKIKLLHQFNQSYGGTIPIIRGSNDSLLFIWHFDNDKGALGFVFDAQTKKMEELQWKKENVNPVSVHGIAQGLFIKGQIGTNNFFFEYDASGKLKKIVSDTIKQLSFLSDSLGCVAVYSTSQNDVFEAKRPNDSTWKTTWLFNRSGITSTLLSTDICFFTEHHPPNNTQKATIYNLNTNTEFVHNATLSNYNTLVPNPLGSQKGFTYFTLVDKVFRTKGSGSQRIGFHSNYDEINVVHADSFIFLQNRVTSSVNDPWVYTIIENGQAKRIGKGRFAHNITLGGNKMYYTDYHGHFHNPSFNNSNVRRVSLSYSTLNQKELSLQHLDMKMSRAFFPARVHKGDSHTYLLMNRKVYASDGTKAGTFDFKEPIDSNGLSTIIGYKDDAYFITIPHRGYPHSGYDYGYKLNASLKTTTPLGKIKLGHGGEQIVEFTESIYQASSSRIYSALVAGGPNFGLVSLDKNGNSKDVASGEEMCPFNASKSWMYYHTARSHDTYSYDEKADTSFLLIRGKAHTQYIKKVFETRDTTLVFTEDALNGIGEIYMVSGNKATLIPGSAGMYGYLTNPYYIYEDHAVRASNLILFRTSSSDHYSFNVKTLKLKKFWATDSISSLLGTFKARLYGSSLWQCRQQRHANIVCH